MDCVKLKKVIDGNVHFTYYTLQPRLVIKRKLHGNYFIFNGFLYRLKKDEAVQVAIQTDKKGRYFETLGIFRRVFDGVTVKKRALKIRLNRTGVKITGFKRYLEDSFKQGQYLAEKGN